jgi:hypothetical protein
LPHLSEHRWLTFDERYREQMFAEIRRLQKENEYLKRQREILKKAMSILGEEPNPGMR